MGMIEGVIARATRGDSRSTLTIFPVTSDPDRHVDPTAAVHLELQREAWQTEDSYRDHVEHIIGRIGLFRYSKDNIIQLIQDT